MEFQCVKQVIYYISNLNRELFFIITLLDVRIRYELMINFKANLTVNMINILIHCDIHRFQGFRQGARPAGFTEQRPGPVCAQVCFNETSVP